MRIGILLAGLMILPGCSTIVRGTTQAVAVQTPGVEKAECELHSEGIGSKQVVTPATIVLDKSQHDIEVSCHKRCYTDGRGVIQSHTEEMAAGNVLVGGVVGLGVDAASGAMNKYEPEVHISMTPIRGCKA